jgi:DNA-binding response OmpR family regulator
MSAKILYIEDEPSLGKIVKETLESQGYEVLLIEDGALVLNAFLNFVPDICILDVMLPNVDGFTLGKQIRIKYPDLPIIFVTAKIETNDLIKGFESGGTDYIRKPFSTKELIVRIENQLKLIGNVKYSSGKIETHKIGHYLFKPDKYTLELKGVIRKLSSRESELLDFLMQHRNQVIERKKLLFSIWGDDSYYNSRTLDVYIRKLRGFFSEDERIEIITLKGKGYHFIVP